MSKEITEIELTEQSLESIIYEIRGQKVMPDFDLARIYGYTTKAFNQQVKNNIEKFPEDFMFQLTKEELDNLQGCKKRTSEKDENESNYFERSKKLTTGKNEIELEELARSKESNYFERSKKSTPELWAAGRGGRSYLPYAFTEQGIYMLMTVLKGELAVKQSKALIRLFKRMKDYIIENKGLIDFNASLINNKFLSYDKKFEEVDEKLKIVMDNFIDPSTYKSFLVLDGQKIEADIAYQTIYSSAKQSIYIIDDYINLKTLYLLRGIKSGVKVTIVSDNIAKDKVSLEDIESFKKEYSIDLLLVPSYKRFHDRFIVVDDGSESQVVYHCGGSSKDAGKRITSIHTINSDNLITILTNSLDEKN